MISSNGKKIRIHSNPVNMATGRAIKSVLILTDCPFIAGHVILGSKYTFY